MEESCNLGERGDMLFDDYLDRSCSRLWEARQMANKSNPALMTPFDQEPQSKDEKKWVLSMKLDEKEIRELQDKYRDLLNYDVDDPAAPIGPLTYVDSNGDALIHIAAQRGDRRTIELLLKAGVDVNQIGDMGNTALHYAQADEIARLLLAHGASVDVVNEFGKRPR